MLPDGWTPVIEEADADVETLPVRLAPDGSVSLLKNISRLLCNCGNFQHNTQRNNMRKYIDNSH